MLALSDIIISVLRYGEAIHHRHTSQMTNSGPSLSTSYTSFHNDLIIHIVVVDVCQVDNLCDYSCCT